ncbi:hypothetical protein U27_05924 [Candidatus Vecturithrix granuli]|uniref:Uncharacterized protein n=1 Tax=Vecturithrix granuli TaxID=1499967 RepID=A0A081C2Z4_VECG1|nr:hypothetical protein U27_05924 [Candidatus Vecturithrix granuli]
MYCRYQGSYNGSKTSFLTSLYLLVHRQLVDLNHRFFDGTPVKARASIYPYRDEVYTETLATIEEKLKAFHAEQVACDPTLNPSPVELTNTMYAPGNGRAVKFSQGKAVPPFCSPRKRLRGVGILLLLAINRQSQS